MFNFWPFKTSKKAVSLRELLEDSGQSSSGKRVTLDTAIQVAAVFGCARVISEGIAQIPLKLMQETGKNRLPARDRRLYDVLATSPNEWQTAFEYWEMVGWHACLTGTHFSYINRSAGGKDVLELLPFEPGQVEIKRNKYTLSYVVTTDGGEKMTIPAESMFVIRGPSWNSWQSIDPIKQARDAIGLSMAIESDASSRHKNGIQTSGVYSVEGKLTPDQHDKLTKWLKKNYSGENAGTPVVIDRAAKFHSTQMSAIDAQSYENRRFQIEETCRFFRVNPIMIGAESKNTTYASAEQMFLAHLVHTLSPWYTRIEKAIDARLLTESDRKAGYYADFVEEGLLRGSAKQTSEILLAYVNGGLMTANEGRGKLDLNPNPNPIHDELRVPANIVGAKE